MSINSFARSLKEQHASVRLCLEALKNTPFVSRYRSVPLQDITVFETTQAAVGRLVDQLMEQLAKENARDTSEAATVGIAIRMTRFYEGLREMKKTVAQIRAGYKQLLAEPVRTVRKRVEEINQLVEECRKSKERVREPRQECIVLQSMITIRKWQYEQLIKTLKLCRAIAHALQLSISNLLRRAETAAEHSA